MDALAPAAWQRRTFSAATVTRALTDPGWLNAACVEFRDRRCVKRRRWFSLRLTKVSAVDCAGLDVGSFSDFMVGASNVDCMI